MHYIYHVAMLFAYPIFIQSLYWASCLNTHAHSQTYKWLTSGTYLNEQWKQTIKEANNKSKRKGQRTVHQQIWASVAHTK